MNLSWHQRPAVIIALLVLFPPAGIPLMWMRFSWAKNTKIGVAIASATLFAVAIWRSQVEDGDRAKEEVAESETARDPSAKQPSPSSPPDTKPTTPEKPTSPLDGPAMIEAQPLLLVPLNLDRFTFYSAQPHQTCCGVSAQYPGTGNVGKHLVAKLHARKDPKETLPSIDKNTQASKVGDHQAVLIAYRDQKRVAVEWIVAGWYISTNVEYERTADLNPAKAAVERIAPDVARQVDSYLLGTPPSEVERRQHVATIAEGIEKSRRETEQQRLKAGPAEFIAKIGNAGVTNDLVASARRDDVNPEELIVTVGSTWHRVVKQERLMAAQNLWKLWSGINTPDDVDKSRIKLVDANGNKVGGSGVMGSSVKVDK